MLLRGVGVTRAVRATVILGAGASRGASFVDPTRQVLPPLDADFFHQAQRLDEQAFAGNVREVIEFVRSEYGSSPLPTLEAVFTQLQGFDQFLKQFSIRPGRPPGRYQRQLDYLLELIPLVFRSALEGQRCRWHDRIAYALRKGDGVISFNYDVLIDDAIKRWSTGIWKADRGYGFRIRWGAESWSAASRSGRFPVKEYLRLLKPHGSLHWAAIDPIAKSLRLNVRAYSAQAARGNIIPPTWDKTILGNWPWKPVWEAASRLLQRTRCLIVIGYSVPQTDLTSQALIRASLSGGDLRLLVVANPDRYARARVIDLARGAIRPHTRILELGTLSDFAGLLDETTSERRDREATTSRLRSLQQRLDRMSSQFHEINSRTEDLEWRDLDDMEMRLDRLEDRVGRIEIEDAK